MSALETPIEETSPRSTVLLVVDASSAENQVSKSDSNAESMAEKEDLTAAKRTDTTTKQEQDTPALHDSQPTEKTRQVSQEHIPNNQKPNSSHPNLTPQSSAGYHTGYAQSQVTPEPPSPAQTGHNTVAYDVGSFFQQPAAAFLPHNSPFGGQTPLSPPRATAMIPPSSPLFPRMSNTDRAPPSPSFAMSPQFSYSYAASDDAAASWNERHQTAYVQNSPQLNAQGMPMSYGAVVNRAMVAGRAYSFEDAMLPPSAMGGDQDPGNPAYSPYGGSQGSAALFTHQASWGYAGPPDMYANTPGSPLQPRTAMPGMAYPMGRPVAPYGQFYPASSPGPPIQTTASNKGPDGANLFIFHIPNHFTNLDMYQLFCPYGNLLSVRIMVEKDTGRSRGFGFVSYDSPESAALAIKELNGFAIGNKRLKVQHKQIRSKDVQDRDFDDNYPHSQYSSSSLPPAGPASAPNPWYESGTEAMPQGEVSGKPDEGTELTSTSTSGETSGYGNNESSPLNSLGTLQSALPEEGTKPSD